VRVVGVTKVVKDRDGLDDPGDGCGTEAALKPARLGGRSTSETSD